MRTKNHEHQFDSLENLDGGRCVRCGELANDHHDECPAESIDPLDMMAIAFETIREITTARPEILREYIATKGQCDFVWIEEGVSMCLETLGGRDHPALADRFYPLVIGVVFEWLRTVHAVPPPAWYVEYVKTGVL